MEKKVYGEFPEFCYKAFDCKKYAEDFIYSGTFRMGCLLSYRKIEDESRRDSTEGIGRTKEPGIVTYYGYTQNLKEKPAIVQEPGYQEHHIEQDNPVYCFCTCLPEVSHAHMLEKFGKYIVKINESKRLAEDINDYFISNEQKFLIEGCKVVYNKGQKLDRKLTDNERLDLSSRQKEFKKFHEDCEFRIVAIKLGKVCKDGCKFLSGQFEPECKFVEVNLNKPLNYLSSVWPERPTYGVPKALREGRWFRREVSCGKSCLPDCFSSLLYKGFLPISNSISCVGKKGFCNGFSED